ncbi:NTF2 fold immunity protein [Solimonas terrae]|nr:NTF2 fold immunity protein [Solimonas terrae]
MRTRAGIAVLGFMLAFLMPVSQAAPDFAPAWHLQTPDGTSVQFPEDARHQPSVLLFWPSWCPYSRALQPYVQDIWNDYRDAGVHVWTINIKETGDPVQAMKDRGLSFPLLLNGDALIDSYGIVRTPWLVVVDGDNRIVYTRPGNSSSPIEVARKVRETLNGLLGARAVPLPTSYPPPYDLHLRQQHQTPVADAEWKPWAERTLAGVGDEEIVTDIAPLGPVADGRAAIEMARSVWAQRYGAEQVAIQAPFRSYRRNRLWVVSGSAVAGHLGDGFQLIVDADSGRVRRISPGALH